MNVSKNLKGKISNKAPQTNLEAPLAIAPKEPAKVRNESSLMALNPYYL